MNEILDIGLLNVDFETNYGVLQIGCITCVDLAAGFHTAGGERGDIHPPLNFDFRYTWM